MKKLLSVCALLTAFAMFATSCSSDDDDNSSKTKDYTFTAPTLASLTGNTVQLTGKFFKSGDQITIADFLNYRTTLALTNVNSKGASFVLPTEATRDRSYQVTITRNGEVISQGYLRPNDEKVELPYALGYYLTGSNEVVTDDTNMRGSRRGYLPGKIFVQDAQTKAFVVWKADAKLVSLNLTDGKFDMEYTTDVTSLDALKGLVDLSGVTILWIPNSKIESIDMTMFPNATDLRAWGDPGSGFNGVKSVNFGTYTTDAKACKLKHVQLERNQITGAIDLRNCLYLNDVCLDDNQVSAINFGTVNSDRVNPIYSLSAKNNKIKELSIENCGQLRKLLLAGNKIERLTLLNNSKQSSLTGDVMQQYVYLFKSPDCFSVTWASATDATGKRAINVEHYWWRVFSGGNSSENTSNGFTNFDGGWVANNPIVQALKAGFEVTCWTYNTEDGADSHAITGHTHAGGSDPCTY